MSQQLNTLINALHNPLLGLNAEDKNNNIALIDALISEGKLHQGQTWASHMTPTINPPALLGQVLAGLHNGNLLSAELYPQLATIEKQLIDWFCQLFGQQAGHFTHGSSYANLEALWQAREKSENNSNIVYASEAAHYSIIKACQILGLEFQAIPTNTLGQIDAHKLREACQSQAPIAIVATAGTTSSGAIDSLSLCIDISREFSSWCHIDAAWGGALILLPEQQYLAGIEQADSICFDPHKALGQPRPCSILLYQQPLDLIPDIDVDYLTLPPKQTLSGSYGGELFLPLWCSLLGGKQNLLNQLQHRLEQAEEFYLKLKQKTDWQVLYSATGIVCFKSPTTLNLTSLEEQGLLSHAKVNGDIFWRVVFASQTITSKALITALEAHF